MRSFVAGQNIERYRALLAKETDQQRRGTLEKLLAEEEAIRAGLSGQGASEEPARSPA
jgi:hypothetical protein